LPGEHLWVTGLGDDDGVHVRRPGAG
jgi:hypothetical protein